jgi:hypothetical protein
VNLPKADDVAISGMLNNYTEVRIASSAHGGLALTALLHGCSLNDTQYIRKFKYRDENIRRYLFMPRFRPRMYEISPEC